MSVGTGIVVRQVKLYLVTSTSPASTDLSPDCSISLLMCSRGWLKYLDPCNPYSRPSWGSGSCLPPGPALAVTIYGINQQMDDPSLPSSHSLCLSNILKFFFFKKLMVEKTKQNDHYWLIMIISVKARKDLRLNHLYERRLAK